MQNISSDVVGTKRILWPGTDIFTSGANLLARKQHMYFFGASVTTVCLFFFVIGRVLTRLLVFLCINSLEKREDSQF